MNSPAAEPLWHGYTLADLDQLARTAARTAFGGRILDPVDRYQAAWSAIAEQLCTADEPPTRGDLIRVGSNATSRAGQDHRHTWGMTRTWGSAEGDMARFLRYWELERRSTASPEEAVVDRTALHQIWPRLSLTHRQVLYAFAIHDGDHEAAAESLGKTVATFRSHLKAARASFRALWHEHETPSRMWGRSGGRGRRSAMQTLVNRRQQRARKAA
jgi:hypothetical protein